MNLKNVSIEELEKEIERRKKQEITAPPMMSLPDWGKIRKCVDDINIDIVKQNYNDSDNKHWIYEAVIDALYGDKAQDYYKWVGQFGG